MSSATDNLMGTCGETLVLYLLPDGEIVFTK